MERVGRLIKQISNNLAAGRNRALKKFGLTSSQHYLIMYLYSRDGQITSQKDISEYMGIKHTSTINILKILEEKKLVYREVNRENAKYKDVFLTKKGKAVVQKMHNGKLEIEEIIYNGLTEKEKEELIRLLSHVYDNLLEKNSPDGCRPPWTPLTLDKLEENNER